jgi:hypothetical protein
MERVESAGDGQLPAVLEMFGFATGAAVTNDKGWLTAAPWGIEMVLLAKLN